MHKGGEFSLENNLWLPAWDIGHKGKCYANSTKFRKFTAFPEPLHTRARNQKMFLRIARNLLQLGKTSRHNSWKRLRTVLVIPSQNCFSTATLIKRCYTQQSLNRKIHNLRYIWDKVLFYTGILCSRIFVIIWLIF